VCTGRRFPNFHYGVQLTEGFRLSAPIRRISKQRPQCRREFVGGAIALKKFRDHVFAQHKVGKDRRRSVN
jgi:hypothetical protein